MTRVLDTSVLYAAFDAGDPRHQEASDILASPEGIEIPLATLTEFLGLVARRRGHAAAAHIWTDLDHLGTVSVAQPQDAGAALRRWQGDGLLSLADSVGIQQALQSGNPLLTYDRHQAKVLGRLRG